MISNSGSTNLRSIFWTLGLIFLTSIFQPYIALFGRLGVSSKCIGCSVWDDTFFDIIVFAVVPISVFYLISIRLKLNKWLYSSVITAYFVVASFLTCTVPLFRDRIAAWSTYSDDESFYMAMMSSFLSMGILSILFLLLLVGINSRKRNS